MGSLAYFDILQRMIKIVLLLCLAWGIKKGGSPVLWIVGYITILTLYIFNTTTSSIELTLAVVALHAALAILYAWLLKKTLSYFHLEGALFWWVALCGGLLIGVI
ncbi:MAG: hypothetical protein KIH62_001420 [Candidatus Kerfeldbacteria bacterium]|nr:hypothetical protein [Candidatus Kerfeldbacteria bacterium]